MSSGAMSSATPSAMTATPSRRPSARRLRIDPDQRVDDGLHPDRRRELLGDERRRRASRLADAESEVAGLAAHRDDEVPPRRRLGVHHQVLEDVDAVVPRRLEAEGVDVRRQVEVVVDRLRDVDDADAAGGARFQLHRRKGRVVAADRDELRHAEPGQRIDGLVEESRILRRIGARDAQVRATAEMDAADDVDRQRDDMVDVAVHDPGETIADADDIYALEAGANRRRADDRIDAGGRPAGNENRELVHNNAECLEEMLNAEC